MPVLNKYSSANVESNSVAYALNHWDIGNIRNYQNTSLYLTPPPVRKGLSNEAIKVIDKIKSFSKLNENWDGNSALSISPKAIENSIDFVKLLDGRNTKVFFAAPSPEGSVLIEIKNRSKAIELFFTGDSTKGDFLAYKDDECEDEGLINSLDNIKIGGLLTWLNLLA